MSRCLRAHWVYWNVDRVRRSCWARYSCLKPDAAPSPRQSQRERRLGRRCVLGGIARATPKAWCYVATQGRDRSRHVVRVLVLACTEIPTKQSQKNRCPSMARLRYRAIDAIRSFTRVPRKVGAAPGRFCFPQGRLPRFGHMQQTGARCREGASSLRAEMGRARRDGHRHAIGEDTERSAADEGGSEDAAKFN